MEANNNDDNVKNKVAEHCEGDLTTKEFISKIVEALTIPADSEDENRNIREDFSILMPDGEKKNISLHPADTLLDLARILKAKSSRRRQSKALSAGIGWNLMSCYVMSVWQNSAKFED